MKNEPYITVDGERAYNPEYGNDRICKCGDPYYRHFDPTENWMVCGCKYCGCRSFVEQSPVQAAARAKVLERQKTLFGGEAFITKYAATTGVFMAMGHEIPYGDLGVAFETARTRNCYICYYQPKDYATTAAEAEVQVAKKLAAKVQAARKALAKAEKLNAAAIVVAVRPAEK